MIESPFFFEEGALTEEEFTTIGKLALRWSHIEHIIGNCLRRVMRLSEPEAIIVIFPMSIDVRLEKLKQLSELKRLNASAKKALLELLPTMKALQFVRNTVIHGIMTMDEHGGHHFHRRSRRAILAKEQIFSVIELTNYAAHAALALRFALGWKESKGERHPLPDRPEIPEFLRSYFPKLSQLQKATRRSRRRSFPG